jgi:hypothetical protein
LGGIVDPTCLTSLRFTQFAIFMDAPRKTTASTFFETQARIGTEENKPAQPASNQLLTVAYQLQLVTEYQRTVPNHLTHVRCQSFAAWGIIAPDQYVALHQRLSPQIPEWCGACPKLGRKPQVKCITRATNSSPALVLAVRASNCRPFWS